MRHHIAYWKMAKREADVTDAELAELRAEEERGVVYVEFLDGERLPLTWNHGTSHWVATRPELEFSGAAR